MIKFLILTSCFLVFAQLTTAALSEERFVEQPLDHFNPQSHETWTMRYFANNMSYEEGGPIFIYVGGDYEIGTYWLEHGHMHDISVDLNAYIFGTEMRFFGRNRPTNNVTTDNLRFLTTEQVLADMAHLIDHIKRQDTRLANARVILVGTAFGGNLATWFRVKYPHHVDGVWSSSSYVEARMAFGEYYEAIGEDLRSFGSEACYRRTWRAFRTMENLIDAGRSEVLDEMFHLCHPLNSSNSLDIERFFEALAEEVSNGILNGGNDFVHDMCVSVTNDEFTNDLEAFAEWFNIEHLSPGCFGLSFQENVEFLSEFDWEAYGVISGRRQYHYLTCTEYGWFTVAESDNQPFGTRITSNYFSESCRQVFGDWMSLESIRQNTERFNVNFGGSQPVVTNVFFTNGGLDPHRTINVQSDIGATVEARSLPLYGHSRDMYSLTENDSPTLRNAKIRAQELITQWVEN